MSAEKSAKLPVRLSDQERSNRLRQLYERTVQWQKRCNERYAQERAEREASALDGCTFAPQICTASQLIVEVRPTRPFAV